MDRIKSDFIEFMVCSGVLTFGDFVTKSGRRTPFFINTGRYDSGMRMARLGEFYAETLCARLGDRFDFLYGPAYKGIPLAVATAMALSQRHGRDLPFAFNRKEAKDHGEGGELVGRKPAAGDRIVIVEDVTTAGTSVHESMALLERVAGIKPVALIVSVDRQERGQGRQSALAELSGTYGIETFAIVTLDDIIAHLHNRLIGGQIVLDDTILKAIQAYRAQYGAV